VLRKVGGLRFGGEFLPGMDAAGFLIFLNE
jgi:hypothetical protein